MGLCCGPCSDGNFDGLCQGAFVVDNANAGIADDFCHGTFLDGKGDDLFQGASL